jgi:Putative porin
MRFKRARRLITQTAKVFLVAAMGAATRGWCQDSTNAPAVSNAHDPLVDLLIQKGILTQEEAGRVQAEAAAMSTNKAAQMPPMPSSPWVVDKAIKSVELYGDARVRYEGRSAADPGGDSIDLQRFRYSLRFGLRGDLFDNFYYGFRLDTGSNPRSPWVTFGTSTSSSSAYYYGPYGKSQAGINVGQLYIGWAPADWGSVTVGKMPNPLFTSSMVWSPNINPEGLTEQFKYTVGTIDFFANFAQFIYQDMNPVSASFALDFNNGNLGSVDNKNIFQVAWQGGFISHITPKLTAEVASTIYTYYGLKSSTLTSGTTTSPYFGDNYVGEGAYAPGSSAGQLTKTYGYSGFGTPPPTPVPGYESLNYPNNQVGLNNLLVLEIPFQANYKFEGMDAHVFGDYAYNLDGKQRAEKAAAGYSLYLANEGATGGSFAAQTGDVKAYQIGLGIGSDDIKYGPTQGLVYGTSSPRHSWEIRTYWQHIEQYSLDPNLLDLDFFNGLENLQGIYVAAAYAFTGNVIGTFRYGHASRINDVLGTGGSSGDIPQINPVNTYDIYQVDLTVRF